MAHRDRLSRLFEMFFIIQAVPGLSAKELAKRCGISTRQCYRDLETLQAGGVPIYNDYGKGYRLVEGSRLNEVSFTLEEALALIYGLKLIEQQKGLIRMADQGKEKLLALLPPGLRHELENIKDRVEIAVAPAVDYSGKEKIFKQINEAIRSNTRLHMKYYSFVRDEITTRAIDPYQLVFKDGFWYVVAFCHHRQEARLFRVDRIQKLLATTERFTPPSNYDFGKYMGSAWQMERGEEFSFKIRFFGEAARFVKETNFHPSQEITEEPGGTVLFAARASGQSSVLRWILTFGAEAEVLEPPELREMVAQVMAAGVRRYVGGKKESLKGKKQRFGFQNIYK